MKIYKGPGKIILDGKEYVGEVEWSVDGEENPGMTVTEWKFEAKQQAFSGKCFAVNDSDTKTCPKCGTLYLKREVSCVACAQKNLLK